MAHGSLAEDQLVRLFALVKDLPILPPIRGPLIVENWTDEDFLKKLKTVKWHSMDDLATCKNVAHNLLCFFLTGSKEEDSISVIRKFICTLEWFDFGFSSARLIVKDFMLHLQSIPQLYPSDTPTPLSKNDLVNKFKNRLTLLEHGNGNYYFNLGLSTDGLINLSQEEAIQKVKDYYDLIEAYYSAEKRRLAKPGEMKRSISFVRSLYVLVLIMLRSRTKDPLSVMSYIKNGGYLRIARRLVNFPGNEFFSINPESHELTNLLSILNQHSTPEVTGIYYILLGIYCGMEQGVSTGHVVNGNGVCPREITNPLRVPCLPIHSSLIDMLEEGCMKWIKDKGLLIIWAIETLSCLTSKSFLEVIDILNNGSDTKIICQKISQIWSQYDVSWYKVKNVHYYHPKETTWRYSKNFSDHVFPELSANNIVQFLFRVVKILDMQGKVDVSRIVSLKNFFVKKSDITYIEVVYEKLFS